MKKTKKSFKKKHVKGNQNLSEEEKGKKPQYARERYRNLSKVEKGTQRQYDREQQKNLLENEYRKIVSRMQEIKTI